MFAGCFTVAYIVIGNEPSEATDSAADIGLFARMFLFVWGNGSSAFGLINYPTVWAVQPDSWFENKVKQLNIILLWFLYVLHIQF